MRKAGGGEPSPRDGRIWASGTCPFFLPSLIHSFIQQILITSYVPGPVLRTRMNKPETSAPKELTF